MRYRFTKDDIMISQNHDGSLALSVFLDGHYIDHLYMGYSKEAALRKFQSEFGIYPDNYKPIGVLPLTNFGGIAIMDMEESIDDYVFVTDNYGNGYKNITKNKIYYNYKGDAYFVRGGKRWYLSEFMRCNIGTTRKEIKETIYYTDRIYGGRFTYDEMVEDARKNYDYGDPTNFLTYQENWWKEYYKVVS